MKTLDEFLRWLDEGKNFNFSFKFAKEIYGWFEFSQGSTVGELPSDEIFRLADEWGSRLSCDSGIMNRRATATHGYREGFAACKRIMDVQNAMLQRELSRPPRVVVPESEASEYTLGHPMSSNHIKICKTNWEKNTWAIRGASTCLNKDGEWEWEPMPSNRDDAFMERTRFTLDEAFPLARKALAAMEPK